MTNQNSSRNARHESCPLCDSRELRPFGRGYERVFLARCVSCGLAFSERVPSTEELVANYSRYPRDCPTSPITLKRYGEILEMLEPARKLNRILDVGCGDGHFLEVARKKGWEVYGTEFTDRAVEVCRSKKISMHQGSIQSFDTKLRFDVITSFEVIEHLGDGRSHMKKIVELLREGGRFYFTTPNFNSLSRRLLGGKWTALEYPDHLTYYSPRTITKLLDGAGMKKLRLESTGFSRERFVGSQNASSSVQGSDESLRQAMETRASLRIAKKVINVILTVFGLGDSLKGTFTKR